MKNVSANHHVRGQTAVRWLAVIGLIGLLLGASTSVLRAQGAGENALNFDGVDDAVDVGDLAVLDGVSQYTLESWVRFDSFGSWSTPFAKRTSDGDRSVLLQSYGSSGAVAVAVNGGYGYTALTLSTGTWYHVAIVFDGSQATDAERLKLYIDGLPTSLSFLGTVPTSTPNSSSRLVLGAEYNSTGPVSGPVGLAVPFDGTLDDLRIWNYARSQAQIQAVMNQALTGTETGLQVYFDFNQGTASGNNTGVTTLLDGAGTADNGPLWNFALTGSASNWITGVTLTTTNTAPIIHAAPPGYASQWGAYGSATGSFNVPNGAAIDGSGNVYIADSGNNRIQKFDASGAFLSAWGSAGSGNGQFSFPADLAIDASGKVYVVDYGNNRIQQFDTNGTYLAQFGSYGTGNGQFNGPYDLAIDHSGNLYVTDVYNYRVQKFDASGTYVSQWGSYGSGNGQFQRPYSLAVDSSDAVYVLDYMVARIQKFNTSGVYQVQWGGAGGGPGQFSSPERITIDTADRVYVGDTGNRRVQAFDSGGQYLYLWGSYGSGDGQFNSPRDVAVSASGSIYVVDASNYRIQRFSRNVSTVSTSMSRNGSPIGFYLETSAQDAESDPLTWSVTSAASHGVVSIVPSVTATPTVYYTPTVDYVGLDSFVIQVSDGALTDTLGVTVTVNGPPVADDATAAGPEDTWLGGTLSVSDPNAGDTLTFQTTTAPVYGSFTLNNSGVWDYRPSNQSAAYTDTVVALVTDSGGLTDTATLTLTITADNDAPFITPNSVLRWGSYGSGNSQFNTPFDVVMDSSGNVFVADYGNNRIQKFDANGAYLTQWGSSGSGNGQFNNPSGLGLDSSGNVYVADYGNHRIQKFDNTGGYVSQFGSMGSGDGFFYNPSDVAIDSSGNLYVVDVYNYRIQKFDSNGTYLTQWGSYGSGDGQFNYPRSVAVDASNNIYVVESEGNRVQKFNSSGVFQTKWGSRGFGQGYFNSPWGITVDTNNQVYVADFNNYRIQQFDTSGTYLTEWGSSGSNPGFLSNPRGMTVDAAGGVYVADGGNNRIQKYVQFGPVVTVTMSENGNPTPFALGLGQCDLENGPLNWSIPAPGSHGTASIGTGTYLSTSINYAPNAGYSGYDYFVAQLSDGVLTDSIGISVTIVPGPNHAPVAVDDTPTTNEDTALVISPLLNDSDLDADPLSVEAVGAPSHGTVIISGTTQLVYTPTLNFHGTDVFTYTASDGARSAIATITVTVNPINDAPVAVDDTTSTNEDTAVSISPLTNDSDVDGDTLAIGAVGGPAHGAAIINGTQVIYTPTLNFHGTDVFTYTATDSALSAVATITVTVNAVNDAPVAADDTASTNEDTAVSISPLTNDNDVDGDPLAIGAVGGPSHGTAIINGTQVLYAPTLNFHGTDVFTYTATDGASSAVATITVTVNAINDAPIAVDDTASTNEDTAVSIAPLTNDSDVDGDPLSIGVVGSPSHGSVIINGTQVIYTPMLNFHGTDVFTYTATDGALSAVATITVTVNAINDTPVAVDDTASTNEDTAVSIAPLTNDSDVDGDTLAIGAVGGPAHGATTINGTQIVYTPTLNFHGTAVFTYTATDGALSAVATITVTINALNDAPVAVNDTATTNEDTAVSITPLTNDSDLDGDTLSIGVVGGPAHGSAIINGTHIVYTPTLNFNGTDVFTYTATDGALSAVATITVTVNAINDAPVAVDDTASTNEDTAVSIAPLTNDSDVDGDSLSIGALGSPSHGATTINGAQVIYTPTLNFHGTDVFTYTATDGTLNAVATITVTVNPINDQPVAVDDSASTNEDTAVSISLLTNDSDVDGDTLSIGAVGSPSHGSALINGTQVIYTPTLNFHGTDVFTYTATDGASSAVATITVTVNAINDAPTAVDDTATTNEDTAVSISLLTNDSDVDGDPLAIGVVGSPSHGSANINGTQIVYTPTLNFHGTDVFTYTATDGALSAIAAITVTVNAINDAPTAVDNTASTNEDTSVNVSVLANDSDLDGDTLSIGAVGAPSHGTAVINGTQVTYTPTLNFNGTDVFTYTATDGALSAVAAITITVNAVNDTPVAVDDTASTNEDTAVSISPLTNDSDIDGDPLAIGAVSSPSHGSAIINGTQIIYTPTLNFNGTDVFTYTATDGALNADATITVTVNPVNDAPIAVNDSVATNEDTPVVISPLSNDSDAEGDSLTIAAIGQPAHGQSAINSQQSTITYTPTAYFNGTDVFTYTVTDGALHATALVTVTVNPVNNAPVALDDVRVTTEDTPVSITPLVNDGDIDGDGLTIVSVTTSAHGQATISNSLSTILYTPTLNFNGLDVFTYEISDGPLTATARVTLTVTSVNDLPTAVDDAATTDEDTAVNIAVLSNDSDIEPGALNIAAFGQPAHGTTQYVLLNAQPTIKYTPALNFSGGDVFTYTLVDANGGTAQASVHVTINPVNDAPEAANDAATTAEDTAVSIMPLINDSDLDGDSLTITAVTQPAHGQSSINTQQSTIFYTPTHNYNGVDSFKYTISDGHGGTAQATIALTITPVNDAPVANADAAFGAANTPIVIEALSNDTDPEGDALSITAITQPAHGAAQFALVSGQYVITYTSQAGYSGPDSFTYTLSDGAGGTALGDVTVLVAGVSNAVTAVDDDVTTSEDAPIVITPLLNDTTSSGTLSVLAVSQPAHGQVTLGADGQSVVYTPTLNYFGADSFTYIATNGVSGDEAIVNLYIDAVNDAPLAHDDAANTLEDTSIDVAVLTNDRDVEGETLTLSALTQPAHGHAMLIVQAGTTLIRYTPNRDYNGTDQLAYTVTDIRGAPDSASVAITIIPVNDVPVLVDDTAVTDEDVAVDITVLANDGDIEHNPLTVTLVSAAQHGVVISLTNNIVRYTPDKDFNGEDNFTYTASDGNGGSSSAQVTVIINAVDDPPEGIQDAVVIQTGQRPTVLGVSAPLTTEVTLNVLANDVNVDNAALDITRVGRARNGRVSIGGGGKIKYAPDSTFITGTDVFTYVVGAAGTTYESIEQVSILLNPTPGEVIAVDDTALTNEDTPVTFDILGNDQNNVPSTTLQFMGLIPGTKGYVVPNVDNTLTYYPAKNANGEDVLTYIIGNGQTGGDFGVITVTINPVNDPPVAVIDIFTTTQNVSQTLNLLANDSDPDGDAMHIVSLIPSGHAVLGLNPNGMLNYQPNPEFYGLDIFAYILRDANGRDDIGLVGVVVTPINRAPAAAPDSVTTAEDTPFNLNVLGNDFDPDADVITVTAVSQGNLGTITLNADNTVSYTPHADANGNDDFQYTVSDGRLSAKGTVHVTLTPVNDAPAPADDTAQTTVNTARVIFALGNDVDVDGDALNLIALDQPTHGQSAITLVDGQAAINYTPVAAYIGLDSFSYTLNDGVLSSVGRITVTVGVTNTAPVAVDNTAQTAEDTPVIIAALNNDADPEGDSLIIRAVEQPAHGFVSTDGRRVTYRPAANYNGLDVITYAVSDGALSAQAHIEVTITPVDDAPVAIDDVAVVARNRSVEISVLANDLDTDGDLGNVQAVGVPSHGTATLPNPGYPMKFKKVTYTPNQDFTGTDVFTYTATDGTFTSVATVTVQTFGTALYITNTAETINGALTLGGRITYTLLLSNYGDMAATDVTVTATLPAGLVFESAVTGADLTVTGNQLVWEALTIPAGNIHTLRYTTVLTTNLAYASRTFTNLARYTASNAGWNVSSAMLTSRGVPTIQIVTPIAAQVILATNNVSATVPIEISLSNFTLPVDGQWRLWVNGVDYGEQLTDRVDVDLPLGAHAISAQLESVTAAPIGPTAAVNITLNRVSKFTYLPLLRK